MKTAGLGPVLLLSLLILPAEGFAGTFNTPVVDGPITADSDPADWAGDELYFEDPPGDSNWGPYNDLQQLWVTWDADGLYIGVKGQLWDVAGPGAGSNTVNVYLDVDYGAGTGISDMSEIDQEALGAISRNLWRPLTVGGDFGADFGFTSWAGLYDRGILDLFDPLAPVNLITDESTQVGVNAPCTDPSGPCQGFDKQDNFSFEFHIPWSDLYANLYPGLSTTVPAGASLALVVNICGGGDSMSEESMPEQSTFRVIDRPISLVIDGNGDGEPDQGWPPSGSISGTVSFSDATDTLTVVEMVARNTDGVAVSRASTPPGGGAYTLRRLDAGRYTVELQSLQYLALPRTVDLALDEDLTGIDFEALKVNSKVRFSASFLDGPAATDPTLELVARLEGRSTIGLEYAAEIVKAPGDPLDFVFEPVPEGEYLLSLVPRWPETASAPDRLRSGYIRVEDTVVVPNNEDTVELGSYGLSVVVPDRVVFFEPDESGTGARIGAGFTTLSLPSEDFYAYLLIEAGFVDDQGNQAIYGLPGLELTTSTMDPAFPTQGETAFWSAADTSLVDQPLIDAGVWDPPAGGVPTGRARFLFSGTAQEVVRLHAAGGGVEGVLEIGILPIEPDHILLQAADDHMFAGEQIPLQGRLYDVAGNPVAEDEFTILFDLIPETPGAEPTIALTGSDGSFGSEGEVVFSTTVEGDYQLVATGETNSGATISSDTLSLRVDAAAPHRLDLVSELALENGEARLRYRVQLVDAYGNPSPRAGSTVAIQAGPPDLVAGAPVSVALDDATGTGSFEVDLVPDRAGVILCRVSLTGLPVESTSLQTPVLFGLVATDEVAPESDENHNAHPDIDTTALYAYSQNDTLVVQLPFTSNFTGAHMALIMESTGTAEGAVGDYFGFPIAYTHELLPDFVFTYKYAANDYADLRRPPPGGAATNWQWYNWRTGGWEDEFDDAVNALAQNGVSKTESFVNFRIPLAVLGSGFTAGRDTLRLQAYVMQEDGDKRPALDSVPHDATVDMVPPPGAGEWWENLPPRVDLQNWAVFVPQILPGAVSLQELRFSPQEVTQGETTLLSCRPVADTQAIPDPRFQVFADLSGVGGDAFSPLNDEGREGDLTAGDGVFSRAITIPLTQLAGDPLVEVQAIEINSGERASRTVMLSITGEAQLTPILTVVDSLYDDHGPNFTGVKGLDYNYPTNGVFFPGVFDLEKMELFDAGDWLAIRVTVGEITDPAQPGSADWNASYPTDELCPRGQRVDLNLQNVVVLIDNIPGKGSTKIPENRWADVAPQDAWDYAVVADGWWKGMIRSNNSRASGDWDVFPNDSDYFFCSSAVEDAITMFVNKERMEIADMSEEELEDAVQDWDFIVMLSGHDGDSNLGNWGGIRWVNEDRTLEWQFGNGKNGEFGRERDANIIDLMLHAGLDPSGKPKVPGRTQEEQLDYTTAEAERRFSDPQIQVACQLEAEYFVDELPPKVVFLPDPNRALSQWSILKDAPVSPIIEISDDSGVASALMRWRGMGEPRSRAREVPAGLLRSDLDNDKVSHIADVPWAEFSDPGVTNLVERTLEDGTVQRVRYMILAFEAVDKAGNKTPENSIEYVVEVPEEPLERFDFYLTPSMVDSLSQNQTDTLVVDVYLPEGSRVRLPRSYVDEFFAADDSSVLQLIYRALGREELDLQPKGGDNETVLQSGNRYLNTAREFEILWHTSDGFVTAEPLLPEGTQFSIHFPRYEIQGTDPADLQLFRYNPEPVDRWVLAGGHSETPGSTLSIQPRETGIYGVFTKASKLEDETLVTGLQLSPNPFSPNGDGIHDFVNITYVLPDQVDRAVVEIYDMRGERVRVLKLFTGEGDLTNRTTGLVWDGKDEEGRYVPMGIYVCRVEVLGRFLTRWERATAAVAVVR